MREKFDLQYQFYYFIKDKFDKLKCISSWYGRITDGMHDGRPENKSGLL